MNNGNLIQTIFLRSAYSFCLSSALSWLKLDRKFVWWNYYPNIKSCTDSSKNMILSIDYKNMSYYVKLMNCSIFLLLMNSMNWMIKKLTFIISLIHSDVTHHSQLVTPSEFVFAFVIVIRIMPSVLRKFESITEQDLCDTYKANQQWIYILTVGYINTDSLPHTIPRVNINQFDLNWSGLILFEINYLSHLYRITLIKLSLTE